MKVTIAACVSMFCMLPTAYADFTCHRIMDTVNCTETPKQPLVDDRTVVLLELLKMAQEQERRKHQAEAARMEAEQKAEAARREAAVRAEEVRREAQREREARIDAEIAKRRDERRRRREALLAD